MTYSKGNQETVRYIAILFYQDNYFIKIQQIRDLVRYTKRFVISRFHCSRDQFIQDKHATKASKNWEIMDIDQGDLRPKNVFQNLTSYQDNNQINYNRRHNHKLH